MRDASRARGWALQVLYAWEARGAEDPTSLVRVLGDIFGEKRVAPGSRPFAEVLVRLVAANLVSIDAMLKNALTNWRLARLSVTDRSVLRLGAAELLYVDDVPPRETIQQMARLAEKYGTAESARFVQGVLDAVARRAPERRSARTP